ncbi:glycine-rich extracellular protein 1 isoform X4 [Loxodonta africana]|uniref:glycine-rich extracellular protein 1 isoform X4 n=1 Tax=Loxodonta africana TaxID=9785 RepID=UPI0030D53E50
MSVGSQEPASPQPHAAHPLSTTQSPHVSSKIGPAAPNGFEPGFGRGGKPQKPGEDCPVPVSVPYLFVASEVPEPPAPTPYSPLLCLPRIWEWEWAGSPARPPPTENGYGAGFMNGHRLGTQSGPAAQNGYAAGFGRGVKPQKPGYGTGPGSRALPAVVGAQPGEDTWGKSLSFLEGGARAASCVLSVWGRAVAQPLCFSPGLGLGGGAKSQKPGYGNGNGLGAQPGLGGGVKPQVPGFGNGKAHGLGTQPGPPAQNGYRAGYGPVSRRWRRHESSEARVQEWAGSRSLPGGRSPARSPARPGRECETSEARIPAREWAGSPARPGSGCEASEAKIWQWKWTGSPASTDLSHPVGTETSESRCGSLPQAPYPRGLYSHLGPAPCPHIRSWTLLHPFCSPGCLSCSGSIRPGSPSLNLPSISLAAS